MSFSKQAVTAIFWSGFGSYLGFAVNFVSQLILARFLLPEDFGVFVLATSIFEVLSILTAWSFSVAIIQMPDEDKLIDTAFWLSLIEGILLLVVAYMISFILGFYYPGQKSLPLVFVLLAFNRALSLISAIYTSYMEKNLNYKDLSLTKTLVSILSAFVAVLFAVYGFGVWSLVVKEFLFGILSFIAFKIISGWKFTWRFSKELAKKLLLFSAKVLASRSLESMFYRADSFLLGLIGGVNILGYYSQARYLADVSNAISAPATAVAAVPIYSRVQHDENKLKEAYRVWNYFLIRLMLPLSLIFFIFPEEVISFLLGKQWINAALPLQWLAMYPVLVSVFENIKALLYGTGKISIIAWIRLLQVLSAIPFVILGFHFYGIAGCAAGFMLSILIGTFAIYLFSLKYTLESLQQNILIPVLTTLLTSIFIFYLKRHPFEYLGQAIAPLLMLMTVLSYSIILFILERKLLTQNILIIYNRLKSSPDNSFSNKGISL